MNRSQFEKWANENEDIVERWPVWQAATEAAISNMRSLIRAAYPTDNCWTSLPDGLLDLLAVIHRDGGHYTTAHGLEKSIRDAEKEILAMTEAQNNMRSNMRSLIRAAYPTETTSAGLAMMLDAELDRMEDELK